MSQSSLTERWHIAFSAALMNAIQAGSFFFTPTTLMPLIVSDFNLPMSLSTVPIALGKVAYVLLLIPGGMLVDHYGPRLCVMFGILGLAIVTTFYSLFITTFAAQLCAHVAMAVFASVSGVPVYSIFIAQWFQTAIGLAMGLVLAGYSAAGTAIPALLGPLAAYMGWRFAMACICAMLWLVALPVTYFCLKENHPELHFHSTVQQHQPPPPPILEKPLVSQRSFTFVAFALSYILLQYCFGCLGENIMFYLTIDTHMSLAFASLFFSALNFASFSAKLLGGHLGDHFDRFHVASLSSALAAIGITFLFNFGAGLDQNYMPHLTESPFAILLFALLFGFGYGATFNSLYALTPILFGKHNLGRTQSALFGLGLCGNAVGSVLTGVLRSKYGSYQVPFFVTALACICNFFVFNINRLTLGGSVSALTAMAPNEFLQPSEPFCDTHHSETSPTMSPFGTSPMRFSPMSPLLGGLQKPREAVPSPLHDHAAFDLRSRTYDTLELGALQNARIPYSSSRSFGTGMIADHGYPIARNWSNMSLRSHLQPAGASPQLMARSVSQVHSLHRSSTFEAMIQSGILSASLEGAGYLGTNEHSTGPR
ncbi:hypothetical protein BWQ96_08730 [Gracilariopsis chorda]|uniref:Major facilitator superfamily (MFS) profile domain-containing protein n=1 Tax=Gracilariopsis chorda TaxID=448386 RepID=A0A2V3IHH3_9FLOR|nr:hypothetical protein BWQ96_08730 [Gracilariopsis chorda]|eukprot:PXF41527.1 hypothetical protein BWQ96_08730 [Gracilariopsis chorda]